MFSPARRACSAASAVVTSRPTLPVANSPFGSVGTVPDV